MNTTEAYSTAEARRALALIAEAWSCQNGGVPGPSSDDVDAAESSLAEHLEHALDEVERLQAWGSDASLVQDAGKFEDALLRISSALKSETESVYGRISAARRILNEFEL